MEDPSGFWLAQSRRIAWQQAPRTGFDASSSRWFNDGVLNACESCVDVHVQSNPHQIALRHISPVTQSARDISYGELLEQVATFAAVLRRHGVKVGDRVLIYMPMIPETAVAMLACGRLGAPHSVVFGGFAAHELAVRIDDCKADVVLAASCGIETATKTIACRLRHWHVPA